MDDLDSPSLPSSNHRRHFFDPRQNHLSDSFLSFDSPMHSHGRSPTSQTPRSRRSSSSSTHSVSSSTHSVSSFHTESTARELADSLNPEDSDTLRLEDCFDDCSDWRQTIDDLLVDNAALLVMLAGPSGDEEDLFI